MVKTTVETNPHTLIALLADVSFSSKWIDNCLEVKILNEASPSERLIHTFFAAPWPVKDRDMVTLSTTTFTNNTFQITISDRNDATPSPSKVCAHAKHAWIMGSQCTRKWKKAKSLTQGGGNPGGKLPTFIANKEMISSMFKTFQNLKKGHFIR